MNSVLRLAGLCAFALALCSCDREPDRQATAGGEILPGSASDAMLPYDALRSQPPIVVPTETAGPAADATESPDPAASDSAETPAPEGATSAEAVPTPKPAAP